MSGIFPLRSLENRRPGRIRPRLDRIVEALDLLGNPQQTFHSVLIVGTNGKGSTAVMLERILAYSGVRTGLETSPHLVRVTERIRIDGEEISQRRLGAALDRLDAFPDLTFFETLTAAALLIFSEEEVDIAVLEAGMGGRWDATRAAGSTIAGLTNVGSDHGNWLGDSVEEISDDKGAALEAAEIGIYGPGVDPWVIDRLENSRARRADSIVEVRTAGTPNVLEARWPGRLWNRFSPVLDGRHQIDNLHLALALAESCRHLGWVEGFDSTVVCSALREARWPGRLTEVSFRGRRILLDGAHNLEAARALAAHLKAGARRYNLVFSCLDDKPVEAMAAVLRPVVGEIVVCPLEDSRAMPIERMLRAFPEATAAPDPEAAVARLKDPVLAAGSLRLVGDLSAEGSTR